MSFHPFSVNRTREALNSSSISQSDELHYWIFSSVIWLFYIYHASWVGMQRDWFVLYDVAMALAILWIGAREAFKSNGGVSGTDFLRRIYLLGVPLGVAVLVASQLLYWVSWFVFPLIFTHQSFRNPQVAWQILGFVIFHGIKIWFWWRICFHLRNLQLATDKMIR